MVWKYFGRCFHVLVEDDVLGDDDGFLQVNYYDGGANGPRPSLLESITNLILQPVEI